MLHPVHGAAAAHLAASAERSAFDIAAIALRLRRVETHGLMLAVAAGLAAQLLVGVLPLAPAP